MGDNREARRGALTAEIADRLGRVRGTMTDDEFGRLVESVARMTERFAEIDGRRPNLTDSQMLRRVFGRE